MNKRSDAQRRDQTVKFRLTKRELTKLETRAKQWTSGNVSDLIRHALETMRTRPKFKEARAR